LAYSLFTRYEQSGWDMRYFSYLGMSVMLPLRRLINDPATEHLLNYRHSLSSLKVSVGLHDQTTASNFHQYTLDVHAGAAEPYSVRKTNFAVTTAALRDGSRLYTRSNFIDGNWSTVMVSAQARDVNLFQTVTASITVGRSPALAVPADGKLGNVFKTVMDFLEQQENEQRQPNLASEPSSPQPPTSTREAVTSSGSGFFVSEEGHVLTNAHVVVDCSEVYVDGVRAMLVDTSSDFDLALLQTSDLQAKSVAVFSASSAMLNSDVTTVGYPYAGLLGGMNVTRGAISSLKGLAGDDKTFQITAPVQSGNSGGPVLAADGEVVGVIVSKLDATAMARNGGDVPQNVNFAIRGEITKLFLAQNQVQPKLSLEDIPKSPEALAKDAALFTSFIECK
jgi:serine protease Do